jgi:hypothetical protein
MAVETPVDHNQGNGRNRSGTGQKECEADDYCQQNRTQLNGVCLGADRVEMCELTRRMQTC